MVMTKTQRIAAAKKAARTRKKNARLKKKSTVPGDSYKEYQEKKMKAALKLKKSTFLGDSYKEYQEKKMKAALKLKQGSGGPRKIALTYYNKHQCVWCGYANSEKVLEVAHISKAKSGTKKNNDPKNLVFLCPTHHREYDLGLIEKNMILKRRTFIESSPEGDWSLLHGQTKLQLSKRAKAAARKRKSKK